MNRSSLDGTRKGRVPFIPMVIAGLKNLFFDISMIFYSIIWDLAGPASGFEALGSVEVFSALGAGSYLFGNDFS